MLHESKIINSCLRNKQILPLFEMFTTLRERDYPMIFKETFPNACIYDHTVVTQMLIHLYEPLNPLDKSALRATILYAKNMLIRKVVLRDAPENSQYRTTIKFLEDYLVGGPG